MLSDRVRSLRRSLLLGSILLTAVLSAFYLCRPKVLEILNLKVTDFILATVTAPVPSQEVITVAIDEASVERYGQWPWPRYRFARLLEKIAAAGAKSVGIDIIFAERDRTSPVLWQETLKKDFGYSIDTSNIPPDILDHDTYLAKVLSKGTFVLGYTFLFDAESGKQPVCDLRPTVLRQKSGADFAASVAKIPRATRVICNYPVLEKAASGSGFLNGRPDIDGVIRRLPLFIEFQDQIYPSFALAVLMQSLPRATLTFRPDSMGKARVSLADLEIPTDVRGNFQLGPLRLEKSKQLSAIEVLEGDGTASLFQNKIVLVGLTAAGLSREYPTSTAASISLLNLHRHSIESLTSKLHTGRTDLFPIWETVISLLLCLLLALCVAHLKTIATMLFCLLSFGLSWFGATLIYQNSGYLFSPLLPTIAVLCNCFLLLTLKFYYFQQQAKAETGETVLLLKSSETSMQSILKAIPDIVFRLDSGGNITFISPAISKYLESPHSLLGRPIFELVAPEDLGKAQHRLNERRTGERATFDLEIRLLLSRNAHSLQETSRYFSLSAEGIYHPNGRGSNHFLGTQGIARDITKRKLLEHQLLQAQKMELIGNLASGIAHDLNNILSGLVSYPDLLLLEIPQDDPLHKKIQVIQKSGKKAAAIVQDLLTLARRSISIDEICNINTILSDYLESVEFQLVKNRHSHITIHTDLQDNLLNVKGSAVHLSKVVMNILNNGLEAMPGGGEVSISTANVYVDTYLKGYEQIPEGEYVCTSIADSGVGIPKDDLRRVFEPFYTKKSMQHSGTGLGMTVIWATIKDHKGFLDIDSVEGQGTTVKFYLPARREDVTSQQGRIVLDDYLGSEAVLIVDDIPEQLDIACNMLSKLGYVVYTATSGEKALEAIRQQPVDLVILDMIMPGGLDGLETYQEITKLYPRQKAIITSGFSESERVRKLLQLGAGDYVQKPYTLEKLGMSVRAELDRTGIQQDESSGRSLS